ncbi:Zinc finger C3H1 domain-containing protein [Nymphon striatum]|nr:Zinc finger C3H1 domain-containing protein [Nymphon striatum]
MVILLLNVPCVFAGLFLSFYEFMHYFLIIIIFFPSTIIFLLDVNAQKSVNNASNVLGDNYETVEMDLDTDTEEDGKENSLISNPIHVQSKHHPKQNSALSEANNVITKLEDIENNDNMEEDEEILRAQLLMSLAKHNKLNAVTDDVSSIKKSEKKYMPSLRINSINSNEVGIASEKSENCSDKVVLELSTKIEPTEDKKPKNSLSNDVSNRRVIINLGEDSSDSEEEAHSTKNNTERHIFDNINAFIKKQNMVRAIIERRSSSRTHHVLEETNSEKEKICHCLATNHGRLVLEVSQIINQQIYLLWKTLSTTVLVEQLFIAMAVLARMESSTSVRNSKKTTNYLNDSMPSEYYLLKKEIAKREASKANSANSSPVPSASQSPLHDNSSASTVKEIDIMKRMLVKQETSLKKHKIELVEEEQKKKAVQLQIKSHETVLQKNQARVMQLKNALTAALNNSKRYEIKLKKLNLQDEWFEELEAMHIKGEELQQKMPAYRSVVVGSVSHLIEVNLSKKANAIIATQKQYEMIKQKCSKEIRLLSGSNDLTPQQSKLTRDKSKIISNFVKAKYLKNNIAKHGSLLKKKSMLKRSTSTDKKNTLPIQPEKEVNKNLKNLSENGSLHTFIKKPEKPALSQVIKADQRQDAFAFLSKQIEKKLTDDNIKIYKNLTKNVFSVATNFPLKQPKLKTNCFFRRNVQKICDKNDKSSQNFYLKYESPLLHFKSYRFSPYFKASKRSYSKEAFSNKIDPNVMLCNFELTGICNDDECQWQHERDYKMSTSTVLNDLSSYFPSICGLNDVSDYSKYEDMLEKFNKQAIGVSEFADVATEDYCSILIDYLNKARKAKGNYIALEKRKWKPMFSKDRSNSKKESNEDYQKELVYETEDVKSSIVDKSDFRYFTSEDGQFDSTGTEDKSSNLERKLNKLSQILEKDSSSSEIWIEYLKLYAQWPQNDIMKYCEKAVQLAPSYDIWWKCLDFEKCFSKKMKMCDELIQFITENSNLDLRSHRLLEVFLGLKEGQKDAPINYLHPSDYSFIWICFIHLVAFGSLLPDLFDPSNENNFRLCRKDCYMINWRKNVMIVPEHQVINYFYKTLNVGAELEGKEKIPPDLALFDISDFKLLKKKQSEAVKICQKLIKLLPKSHGCLASPVMLKQCGSSTVFPYPTPEIIESPNQENKNISTEPSNLDEIKNQSLLNIYQEACKNFPDTSAITHLVVCLCKENVQIKNSLLLQYISTKCNSKVEDVEAGLTLFSILLELNNSRKEIIDAYEAAICSYRRTYLVYVMRMNLTSRDVPVDQQFANVVKKCLFTMPVNVHAGALCDYHFHNQVIDLFMANVVDDCDKVDALNTILGTYPNNYQMVDR